MEENFYTLLPLPYSENALEPIISAEQLKIHHDKHHKAYVDKANAILERLDKSRAEKTEEGFGSLAKQLSFNVSGHILHSLFWTNLRALRENNLPSREIEDLLVKEFGSFGRFKDEFSQTAISVEGSGWAALTRCSLTGRPLITQIEKHNLNLFPEQRILMVLDVWEHAYYLDYQNERSKFVSAFWDIVNWDIVNERLVSW